MESRSLNYKKRLYYNEIRNLTKLKTSCMVWWQMKRIKIQLIGKLKLAKYFKFVRMYSQVVLISLP